jgi:N-acetylglucosaminyldiphosphoundecaprenol N-acetyl-beta-D-mannosaminyltransferase
VPVTCFSSYREAVEHIVDAIRNRASTFCVAINPEKICMARRDPSFLHIVRAANLHICDGVGAALAARLLQGRRIQRITGIQLFLDLIARAESDGLRVFLYGASPESNEGAYNRLLEMHPRLQVVGRQDGYLRDDKAISSKIRATDADMLCVAMGSPRQERWIAEYGHRTEVPYCMGVGGTFDVLSGRAKWAPAIFRRTGTEWLYRLIREPRRIRRQVVFPGYMVQVFRQFIAERTARTPYSVGRPPTAVVAAASEVAEGGGPRSALPPRSPRTRVRATNASTRSDDHAEAATKSPGGR